MTRIASIIFVTWVQVHASGSAPIGVHRSRKAVTNGRRRRRNSNVTPTSPPPCFASHLRYHRIYDDSLLSTKLASAKNSCDGVIDRNRRMNKSDINALVKGKQSRSRSMCFMATPCCDRLTMLLKYFIYPCILLDNRNWLGASCTSTIHEKEEETQSSSH